MVVIVLLHSLKFVKFKNKMSTVNPVDLNLDLISAGTLKRITVI